MNDNKQLLNKTNPTCRYWKFQIGKCCTSIFRDISNEPLRTMQSKRSRTMIICVWCRVHCLLANNFPFNPTGEGKRDLFVLSEVFHLSFSRSIYIEFMNRKRKIRSVHLRNCAHILEIVQAKIKFAHTCSNWFSGRHKTITERSGPNAIAYK